MQNYAPSEHTVYQPQPTTMSLDPSIHYQPSDSQFEAEEHYDETKQLGDAEAGSRTWTPERTKGLLAWFSFFCLGSVALTLAALFGGYSTATSNLYIVRMEPYAIYNASVSVLLSNSHTTTNTSHNITSIPSSEFFAQPLPWRYEFGIAGVCRAFNTSDLSSSPITYRVACTPQLHPTVDLLRQIAADIPEGTSSAQYKNWEALLNAAVPGFQGDSSAVSTRGRLAIASSALLILSIVWSILVVLATIFHEPMYPRGSICFDIVDALFVIAASAMWTAVVGQVQNAYEFDGVPGLPQGVHTGPGFWVMWAIGVAKLVVTPMMMWGLIKAIVLAVYLVLLGLFKCLESCNTEKVRVKVDGRWQTIKIQRY
ncbi:hypothetical protein B0H19DRAFT_1162863 [Mycena capillaripes]|nr:hypothetical protein B0H19DRAFT_1162863 [Mycena capillaripes]